MFEKIFLFRNQRRLSILPEVNEDSDMPSPIQDRDIIYEIHSRNKDTTWSHCDKLRINTEKSSASLDSYLDRNSSIKKPRQYSDSCMIIDSKGISFDLFYI